MKNTILSIFLLLPLILIGQDKSYLDRKWEDGMYKTLADLKANKPTLPILGTFKKDTIEVYITFQKKTKYYVGYFNFEDRKEKSNLGKQHKSFFAVCEDGDVFIPRENYLYFNYVNYFKLEFLNNQYAVFKGYRGINDSTFKTSSLLDLNTGETKILTKKFLKKMVKNNKALYEELKKTSNNKLDKIAFFKKALESNI